MPAIVEVLIVAAFGLSLLVLAGFVLIQLIEHFGGNHE